MITLTSNSIDMSLTQHYYTKFEEDNFYHIYNRSVDRKAMFNNDGNYDFFLKKYDLYLSSVVETYAYCLLGNHFHLLVRIRNLTEFRNTNTATVERLSMLSAHDIVSRQFRKFFQSYSLAFNKQQERTGTLFQTPFKRALVDSDSYFTQLVYYIHANPQLHGLTEDFKEWKWSSYGRILLDRPSKLKKDDVLNWFGTKANYIRFHSENQTVIAKDHLMLENE